MDKLHEVAKVLLEKEKLEADEFMKIFPYEKEEVEFEDLKEVAEKIEDAITPEQADDEITPYEETEKEETIKE